MVNIKEREYKRAYKEVTVIIDSLEDDVKDLIPKKKIEFYRNHMDIDYNFEIDYDKSIKEQNILYPTKCILANLFKEYVANEQDKKSIIEKEKEELKEIERKKIEKYNPNEIFNKNNQIVEISKNHEETSQTELIEYEEPNIFQKIKNKIIEFFKRKLKVN